MPVVLKDELTLFKLPAKERKKMLKNKINILQKKSKQEEN